jgi:hypothetical protein
VSGGDNALGRISPHPPSTAESRAAARRYLERSGNADVLAVLGLDDTEPAAPGRQLCPRCGGQLSDPSVNGGFEACRRRRCAELRTTPASDARSRR